MKRTNLSKTFWLAVLLTMLFATPLLAQRGDWWRKYDPVTEVEIKGTVEEVKEVPKTRGGAVGLHLLVKTEQGVMEVHLGPKSFAEKQQFTFAKGDQLEVIGSKVKNSNADALIAREVKKGGKTLTLRNAQGIAAWSAGKRAS